MAMTSDERSVFSTKVRANLARLEAAFPSSREVHILHGQLNTIAIEQENIDGVARGTYGGVDGTVHPDSGGTGKGDQE